ERSGHRVFEPFTRALWQPWNRRPIQTMACEHDHRECGPVRIHQVPPTIAGCAYLRYRKRAGCIIREASTPARKCAGEKFRGGTFPGRFHSQRHPGLEIRLRKNSSCGRSGTETERGRNTTRGGIDPIAPQNGGPIPSGFGGHSRLLLLRSAARVLAANYRANSNDLQDELSDKSQVRTEGKTCQSSKHHPNSQSRSRSKRALRKPSRLNWTATQNSSVQRRPT